MSEKKDELVALVMNENVSAIQILEDRLSIPSEEVVELIKELLEDGKLNGTLTEDSTRFFKSDVKLSEAPAIEREEAPPEFLSFNARPAIVTAIIGFIVVAAGVIVNAFASNPLEQNFAAILILLGVMITIVGLYCVSQRKTPA